MKTFLEYKAWWGIIILLAIAFFVSSLTLTSVCIDNECFPPHSPVSPVYIPLIEAD